MIKKYKLVNNEHGVEIGVWKENQFNFVPFAKSNTDYQEFLQHLAQGLPVEAVDGTVMTESEIAALYQTLTQPNT